MSLSLYPTSLPWRQLIKASTRYRLLGTKETRHTTQYQDNGHSFVWFYCIKRALLLFPLLNSTNFVLFWTQFKLLSKWLPTEYSFVLMLINSRFFVLAQQHGRHDVTRVALLRYRFRKTKGSKVIKNSKIKHQTIARTIVSLLCLCIEFALSFHCF